MYSEHVKIVCEKKYLDDNIDANDNVEEVVNDVLERFPERYADICKCWKTIQ